MSGEAIWAARGYLEGTQMQVREVTSASRAAHPVHVVLRQAGQIEVDHQIHCEEV